VDPKETECDGAEWIKLAHKRVQ